MHTFIRIHTAYMHTNIHTCTQCHSHTQFNFACVHTYMHTYVHTKRHRCVFRLRNFPCFRSAILLKGFEWLPNQTFFNKHRHMCAYIHAHTHITVSVYSICDSVFEPSFPNKYLYTNIHTHIKTHTRTWQLQDLSTWIHYYLPLSMNLYAWVVITVDLVCG